MNNSADVEEEQFEVWEWEQGVPTGCAVPRSRAHREGIPHEAVHLWIVRKRRGALELLFQMRAPDKENYPGCLDISVGGHVPFGLSEGKVAYEAEGELGIDLDESTLIDLGWYRYQERTGELFQREFQHVFLLEDNRELDRYSFRDGEVTGLYAVPYNDFKGIIRGEGQFTVEAFAGNGIFTASVIRDDFHPQLFDVSMERYLEVLFRAIDEFTRTGGVSAEGYFRKRPLNNR